MSPKTERLDYIFKNTFGHSLRVNPVCCQQGAHEVGKRKHEKWTFTPTKHNSSVFHQGLHYIRVKAPLWDFTTGLKEEKGSAVQYIHLKSLMEAEETCALQKTIS